MARALTTPQRELLRSPDLKAWALVTFYLDEGTYRFCDDDEPVSDGTNNYIGANALGVLPEVRSGSDLAAEPITLICDGNRMAQYGISDPARVLRDMAAYLYQQRRVDLALGLGYSYSKDVNLVIPLHAGKINTYRLVDAETRVDDRNPIEARLEIVVDALAARYQRATHRTRSDADQKEIVPTDRFYEFTADATQNERTLYWGKKTPGGQSGFLGWAAWRQDNGLSINPFSRR